MAAEKPTIMLVHGLWMTPLCWEEWIAYYESKGYKVIAPGWPGIDGRTPAEIRADPKPMADKSIENIVASYEAVLKTLPSPPIIMGHSFGGLFTQILLSKGYGCAGVGICPVQPAGIFALPFSTLKAGFPILSNPFDYASTVKISKSEFHYCFGNHTSQEESDKMWERYSVPSVAHVLWQGALSLLGDPKKQATFVELAKEDRAPLLLVAGSLDHVVPPSIVEKEFKAYSKAITDGKPVVEYKLFEGKSHGIVNQEGWKEVADYALEFAEKNRVKS
jgi:pimeloyl-ACP methyl ester carboxylesterase